MFNQLVVVDAQGHLDCVLGMESCDIFMNELTKVYAEHPSYSIPKAVEKVCEQLLDKNKKAVRMRAESKRKRAEWKLKKQQDLFGMTTTAVFRNLVEERIWDIDQSVHERFNAKSLYEMAQRENIPWRQWEHWIREKIVTYLRENFRIITNNFGRMSMKTPWAEYPRIVTRMNKLSSALTMQQDVLTSALDETHQSLQPLPMQQLEKKQAKLERMMAGGEKCAKALRLLQQDLFVMKTMMVFMDLKEEPIWDIDQRILERFDAKCLYEVALRENIPSRQWNHWIRAKIVTYLRENDRIITMQWTVFDRWVVTGEHGSDDLSSGKFWSSKTRSERGSRNTVRCMTKFAKWMLQN